MYRNNTTWSQLHGLSAKHIATGYLDTTRHVDLVIDFGAGVGIWAYINNASWSRLHGLTSEGLVLADIDSNGIDDVVVDFGASLGIWAYRGSAAGWSLVHPISPDSIVAGRFH